MTKLEEQNAQLKEQTAQLVEQNAQLNAINAERDIREAHMVAPRLRNAIGQVHCQNVAHL